MSKHSRKRKKLLTKARIKTVLDWIAVISTIAVNIYSFLRE